MDVRCSRCGTEYDFDDALVSERGTTVKCTNCGHQFKVYPGGGGGAPERWVVRKSSGRELVYTSLRDLQRAIAQKQVGPNDQLQRGGYPLRALGMIAELEPFFQAQSPSPNQPPDTVQRTLLGMAPSGSTSGGDTVPDHPPFIEAPTPPPYTAVSAGAPGFVPKRAAPPPPPRPSTQSEEQEPRTVPRNPAPEPSYAQQPVYAQQPAERALAATMQSPGSYAAAQPSAQPRVVDDAQMNAAFRAYQDSFSDESIPSVAPRQTFALRWIVGLVILAGLAFVGGTVGVRYVKKLAVVRAPVAPLPDNRVQKLLAQSDAAFTDGDLESAKEELDKASALAEQNPAVLSGLARLEAARADVSWLALRLIDPNQKVDLDAGRAELEQRIAKVHKAVDAASAVAPNDPAVLRVRIDALRLDGNVAGARGLVASLGADATDPDSAYVLAALDLAEPKPAWPTIIDRMRAAASAERGIGRARAALIYALASSGAVDAAKDELTKLESASPANPLLSPLRAFVGRAVAGPTTSASAAPAAPSVASPLVPVPAVAQPTSGGEQTEAVPKVTDFRKLLEDASSAKRSGDLTRAESLYLAARAQQPGNVEALAGLGDVARMRGDTAAAATFYDSVLQQNPTYLPTLIASADMKWASGNRAGALALYKRVAGQADPGTPYGQHASARIAEAAGASGSSTPSARAPAATPTAAPTATSQPPPTDTSDLPAAEHHTPVTNTPSNVDTSDLPGFGK